MFGKVIIINKHHNTIETSDMKIFYIGRGSLLGNPFSHLYSTEDKYFCMDRQHAVDEYKIYFIKQFKENIEVRKLILEMYNILKSGVNIYLKCYCYPLQCHGDVIKKLLENQQFKTKENV